MTNSVFTNLLLPLTTPPAWREKLKIDLTTLGVSSFMQTVLDDPTAAAALATLGVSPFMQTMLDDATASEALNTLGIGSLNYTPTLFNTTNLSASTAFPVQYLRVANRVIIAGYLEADAVTTAILTELQMSIPIASNFTVQGQANGAAVQLGAPIDVVPDFANNRIRLVWNASSVVNLGITFILMYQIV